MATQFICDHCEMKVVHYIVTEQGMDDPNRMVHVRADSEILGELCQSCLGILRNWIRNIEAQ